MEQENYVYIKQDDKYQLFRQIPNGYKTEFIIFKRQWELAKALKEEYNAEILQIKGYDSIYEVWFNNLTDLQKAVDYLNALDVIKQLTK